MEERERIAHHEAAHVVMSHVFGGGPTGHGIDLDAPTSVIGAFGNAGVAKFPDDPTRSDEQRRDTLLDNVAITCAGAAADARSMNRPLDQALKMQPGDRQVAQAEILQSPLISTVGKDLKEVQEERDFVLQAGLERAEIYLTRPENWSLVEKVAKACLASGGKLSKEEIKKLLQ